MKVFNFLLLFLLITFSTYSQEEESSSNTIIRLKDNRILGKIVNNSGKAVEAVTVQLYLYGNENGKDSLIAGMFTKANGDFSFDDLPAADSFKIVVSGIGVKEWNKTILKKEGITDLGNVVIEPEQNVMSNVTITAQRPLLQMGIDRKIFNVERSITTTGGTALDVMRNIPSVSVDVEGNVLLRNAQPQIFVDGRPTILTPDQIPADQIERIELITNPSARFDAASTAGIINLVMKRNRRIGLNGVITIGAGLPGIYNGNISLNARQGKFNFFVSESYNRNANRAKGQTFRQNKSNGIVEDLFNQYSTNRGERQFNSMRFGLDFFATNRSTFSVTQNIVNGKNENTELQDQEYLDANRFLERYGKRESGSKGEFDRYNTQFNFTHKFPKEGKEFSANVNYNYGNSNDETTIFNSFFFPDATPYGTPAQVRNAGKNNNDQYTFQVDYVNPFGKENKLEAGIRSFINEQQNFFSSFSKVNGQETLLPLGNNYAYRERVNAAYVSYSNRLKKFSYQVGLRAEVSKFEGELVDSAKTFGYEYPKDASRFFDALFPSIFLTKKLGETAEVQLNYTRRIRRPGFRQINPFIDINDPFNLNQGNPQLQPEFVNSFEFNYHQEYEKGNFLGVIYYRNNRRDITRYGDTISTALHQQLNNPAIDPNAILNTFINARSTNTLGLELTLEHNFKENFSLVPTIDMQYQKVNADVDALRLSNSGFNWDAELTFNYRFTNIAGLFKDMALQLSGDYESSQVTAQGRNLSEYQVDFGLRKDFLKDKKATLSFNINDIFKSQRWGSIYDTENFYQESFRKRNIRGFRINFAYKFGKNDFNLFKREERSDEGE